MLLHHAQRPARTRSAGSLVPLTAQDRSRWDTDLVAEGVTILQGTLARDGLGEYQAQAAIAALHCNARSTAETDWVQVVEWYDELVALTDSPVHRLNRAVAVGEADGARAGLAALEPLDPPLPRYTAVAELGGAGQITVLLVRTCINAWCASDTASVPPGAVVRPFPRTSWTTCEDRGP